MTKTLLSIGHGFSARALSRKLIAKGWKVIGTTRDETKHAELSDEGVDPLVWPGAQLPFKEATHVLTSVAPGKDGDPVRTK